MADKTLIEWTDASWNPVVGCSIKSPGCIGCYAMRQASRIEAMHAGDTHYAGTTSKVKGKAVWTGRLALAPKHILTQPLRWRHPRRIFVNSMGDLFHEDVPDAWIDQVFAVMALAPQHTFQLLTKRSARMREYLAAREMPLPNVWLGVSAERQQEANERIPDLLATPAAIRFVSAEPLLGPINLRYIDIAGDEEVLPLGAGWLDRLEDGEVEGPRIDWIIAGGESGPYARPMHPDWPRQIRDQCADAGVAFFFKQWGEWLGVPDLRRLPGGAGPGFGVFDHCRYDEGHEAVRVGKPRAGRLLDGVEHSGFPGQQATREAEHLGTVAL